MTIERIVVCDDIDGLADGWVDEICGATGLNEGVERLHDPADQFAALLARIPRDAENPATPDTAAQTSFDIADVLVVDYDLLDIGGDRVRHTGEEFARIARLYSDCDFIVIMNQFENQASFDLEMIGHLGSFADLNIGSQSVGSRCLWGAERDGGEFAPWYWPDIAMTIEARRHLVDMVAARLDDPLLGVLDFPVEMLAGLSDRAAGFLSSTATKPEELTALTVRDFLIGSTEHKEIERAIASDPRRAAAFAVARLWKWYSRAVIGPQDLLVDVPHLVQRLPFVMKAELGNPADGATWNAAVRDGASAIVDQLEPAKFQGEARWLGRDAYWWPKVLALPELQALRDGFDSDTYADMVFAEDASIFIPFEKATPFRAGFYNQFDVRYLAMFEGVSYAPGRRLAAV